MSPEVILREGNREGGVGRKVELCVAFAPISVSSVLLAAVVER